MQSDVMAGIVTTNSLVMVIIRCVYGYKVSIHPATNLHFYNVWVIALNLLSSTARM